jgi:hypothetical protein
MRAGIRIEVDVTATIVTACNHRGHSHIEMRIRLSLAVHTRKAVDKTGNNELPGTVNYLRDLGHRDDKTRPNIGDFAVLNNDDGVLLIESGTPPVRNIDDGSTEQNQRNWTGVWRHLRRSLR